MSWVLTSCGKGARYLFDIMQQEKVRLDRRRKKKKKKKATMVRGSDGIDVLPDEVLQHVLSFLPSRETVQTCVLARRWRHLWKSVPALRMTDVTEKGKLTELEFGSLERFMNNLLLLRDQNAPLDLFDFFIKPLDYTYDIPQCGPWIQQALQCKCQILKLEYYDDQRPLILPDQPVISQHLTTLEFYSITLTRKILDFSSCLALKNLQLTACDIASRRILSPSVERMTIKYCSFETHRTRISAPHLVQLELSHNYGLTPLLGEMPSLVQAFVRLVHSQDVCSAEEFGGSCYGYSCDNCDESGDGNKHCVLLKALSKAQNLELVAETRQFIFKRDLMWCPIFCNLKTLLLNEWCVAVDFRALICFLQHAPLLEMISLQLDEAPKNWVERKECYNTSKHSIVSKKLKVVEIECEEFDERVCKIIRIFRSHCVWIEQINVHRSWRNSLYYSFENDLP